MLSKNQLKYKMCKYCEEGRLPEVEGYSEAIASPEKYVLHHRMEIQPDGTRLSKQWMIDHGIYFNLHPCMLVFMPADAHNAMHCALTHKDSKHNQEHINRGAMTSLKTPGQEFFAHYGKLPREMKDTYTKDYDFRRYYGFWPWEGDKPQNKRVGQHPERGHAISLSLLGPFGKEFYEHTGKLPCEDRKLYAKLRQRRRFNNPLPWEVE